MARITEPLREEHKELFPHVETLRQAADALSGGDETAFREKLDDANAFLVGHLIPHATAEEQALYPVVAGAMGAELATRTMSRASCRLVGRRCRPSGTKPSATGLQPSAISHQPSAISSNGAEARRPAANAASGGLLTPRARAAAESS